MIWIFYLLWFILKRKVSLPHVIFSPYLKYSQETWKYCTGSRDVSESQRSWSEETAFVVSGPGSSSPLSRINCKLCSGCLESHLSEFWKSPRMETEHPLAQVPVPVVRCTQEDFLLVQQEFPSCSLWLVPFSLLYSPERGWLCLHWLCFWKDRFGSCMNRKRNKVWPAGKSPS